MKYLLEFLLIAIIVLWVIRVIIRAIFPVMLKSVFGNMQDQPQNGPQRQSRPSRPEGAISIDYMPKKERKGNSDKLGDFVDYEEVK